MKFSSLHRQIDNQIDKKIFNEDNNSETVEFLDE
jgi:hypothetical protein